MEELIKTIGLLGIIGIIFAESGLLIGFFLPGDSLLFTAGFLASQGVLPLAGLLIGCFLAAVIGDSVGYFFGRRVGPRLFQRDDSFLFHRKNVVRAQDFYEKHGSKTIVLARFMPIVRTFAPIVAGVGQMNYRRFLLYNILGGLLWTMGISLAGYFLGSVIPDVDKYLLPIIVLIVFISIAPTLYHVLKDAETRASLAHGVRQLPSKMRHTRSSTVATGDSAPFQE